MNAQQRQQGLGASDAAAAVGLSKWKTPFQLWQEKLGRAKPGDDEALHLEMGTVLEPVAIARFEKKHKVTVTHRQHQAVDHAWPRRWATLDGIASDGGLVEAKSVGFADPREWGDEFEDGAIPMPYLIQVHHSFACLGPDVTFAWVPVIVLNRQFRVYRVQRDEELIAMLTEKERAFWWHVENDVAPPPVDYADAARQWPEDTGTEIECDLATSKAIDALATAKAKVKAAEMDADEAKATIAKFMGANSVLVDASGKKLATWKKAKDSTKVDLDKLRAEFPELCRPFEFTQPGSRRMLLK